jgi:hypothetical protein
MRRRDHDAEIGAEMSGKECDCRRRFDTYDRNVGSCGGKPSNESCLEKFS